LVQYSRLYLLDSVGIKNDIQFQNLESQTHPRLSFRNSDPIDSSGGKTLEDRAGRQDALDHRTYHGSVKPAGFQADGLEMTKVRLE
jgi:hypothetical protein